MEFKEFELNKKLLKGIEKLGFTEPTPIQEKMIPYLLQKSEDIVGLAQTGTGKTAAFGLPVIQNIEQENRETQAMVLAPTRELCLQITDDLHKFSHYLKKIKITAIYGGAAIGPQIREIKRGSHIIVATPGRLLDLLNRKAADISNIKYLILDEADMMLNMGFKEELDAILQRAPKERQTILLSATMPEEVEKISLAYMNNPLNITIGKRNSAIKTVEHHYYTVNSRDKYRALKRLIDFNKDIYGIVFCRTRISTQDIATKLRRDGYNAAPLHGDLSQAQRESVMSQFRNKQTTILIATDIAARGLDVNNLSNIINFDLPDDIESYTHRSGRTGRAGKNGISIAIVAGKDRFKIHQIERAAKIQFVHKEIPSGMEIFEKKIQNFMDSLESTEINPTDIEKMSEETKQKLSKLISNYSKEELLLKLISSTLAGDLLYYKTMPDINDHNLKFLQNRKIQRKKPVHNRLVERKRTKKNHREYGKIKGFSYLKINIGKKDNILPQQIIGLVNESTRNRDIRLGKIEINPEISRFQVENSFYRDVFYALDGYHFRGRKIRAVREGA